MAKAERIQKVNSLLVKEISEIILRKIDFPKNIFVTVISANVSKDLQKVDIFLAVFPEKEKDKCLEVLNKNIYKIQKILDKKLKMKPVPKIVFKLIDVIRTISLENS
ncbi:MAG: 30S ribosome-binding factor RbfA [Minisyncoccia bacterium]